MRKHFLYDGIFLLDGDLENIKNKLSLIEKKKDLNILGLIFNHRKFSLNEINNIRTEIENLDLDHLMFSIRPSFKFEKKQNINLYMQLIFAIKISKIYSIKNIFIPEKYNYLLKKKK